MKASFNLNDYVYVQLNDWGREIHKKRHEQIFKDALSKYEYVPPAEDADGWSKWQMHDLMDTFGSYMYGFHAPMNVSVQIELAELDAPP